MSISAGPNSGRLLAARDCKGETVEVRQHGTLRWLRFRDRGGGGDRGKAVQAGMDISRPAHLILPYTQAMLAALVLGASVKSVLNLGFGGGMFYRYFNNLNSTSKTQIKVRSVEKNPLMAELAVEYFLIPEQYDVTIDSAESFIRKPGKHYDLILCDLCGGDGTPECLHDPAFYKNCFDRVNPDGVIAVNLLIREESRMLEALRAMRRYFPYFLLCPVPDHTNTIVFALPRKPVDKATLRRIAPNLQPNLNIDLPGIVSRLIEAPSGKC